MDPLNPLEIREPEAGVSTPLLVHIPDSAAAIPSPRHSQIVLDHADLEHEVLAAADRYTDELFSPHALTLGGIAIVHDLLAPDSTVFPRQVAAQLDTFGRCLILDARSFSSPLPAHESDPGSHPDLCLGYDDRPAQAPLIAALTRAAAAAKWRVGHNSPFSGSYVPPEHFGENPKVISITIGLNRRRYMDEATGRATNHFDEARDRVGLLLETAVLFEAFRNTSYCADTPGGEICIRIGECCPALDALFERTPHTTWAYVTAHNPNGKQTSDSDNRRAQRELENELRNARLTFYRGAGRADIGNWPPEQSVLILGISEERALSLGRRYDQAAIVVGTRHEPARLTTPSEADRS